MHLRYGATGVIALIDHASNQPLADYVGLLLSSLYPYADIAVTADPDGVHVEVHEASFTLHASIGDDRSALLATFEALLLGAYPDGTS